MHGAATRSPRRSAGKGRRRGRLAAQLPRRRARAEEARRLLRGEPFVVVVVLDVARGRVAGRSDGTSPELGDRSPYGEFSKRSPALIVIDNPRVFRAEN